MRYRVLGPFEVTDNGTPLRIYSPLRRRLLALLLLEARRPVSADRLADALWRDDLPADPSGAVQSHVHRLRRTFAPLGVAPAIETRPAGYVLHARDEDIGMRVFVDRVRTANDLRSDDAARAVDLLDEALALWRGPALAEFLDHDFARAEALHLEETRFAATERRAELLVVLGREDEAIVQLEQLLAETPTRERACALLMRALYGAGRPVEALARYETHRRRLADDLGVEPSSVLRDIERAILDHTLEVSVGHRSFEPVPAGGALSAPFEVAVRYLARREGANRLAWATTADKDSTLVLPPAWCTSIDVIASGRDTRSDLISGLAQHHQLVLYDRQGTGMSGGVLDDASPDAGAAELIELLEHLDSGPLPVFAISQAGLIAVTVAARRPELVSRLVLYGSYANGPATFHRPEVAGAMVTLVRAHWGIASRALAQMFIPGASPAEIEEIASSQRRTATAEVAARLLAVVYEADVSPLLASVQAPVQVLHYLDDPAVPVAGGQQLAAGLRDARFVPLVGRSHLPPHSDLETIVGLVDNFLAG
jgi:DNA-binding SARP family transcriptional activator/pimeloyl-ACP methyl ester carboxylesterase